MTAERPMKITGFVSGKLTATADVWQGGDPTTDEVTLPVPCYLIEVGEHRILFDTGLHPESGVERYGDLVAPVRFDLPDAPPAVDPTMVVLSHLHFDHAGGLYAYPTAPVVLQRSEWEAAQKIENPEESICKPVDFEMVTDPILVDGEHDLLGDGQLRLRPLPGHTPGSQALIADLGGDRRVVFAADACYFPETIDSEVGPPYAWDRELELESLRWLRGQRDAGAQIVYGHDSAAGTFQA